MKARTALGALIVVLGTATCVRLGFWQIERWHEKRTMNAAMERAVASAPFLLGDALPSGAEIAGRKVRVLGRYDETRQVLLGGRVQARLPGVEVITPLLLPGDSTAVLVDRGWLYAPDAAHARPQEFIEPGPRAVTGIARAFAPDRGRLPMLALERDSVTLWSARALNPDSLRARVPYALATFFVVELPGPRVPGKPLRGTPRPLDEFMHVSYAIQWFLFGAILLGGSLALVVSGRRSRREGVGAPLEDR
jgi:surfeit locus 1 family protein